jgi:hypothetical protein
MRSVYSGVPEPPNLIQIIWCVSIWGGPDTTVTKEFGIFNELTILNCFQSIAQETRCQFFHSPETDPAPNISNYPGIDRLSKQYRVDVSYSEIRLTYCRLTWRIELSISSLQNELQAHPNGTMLLKLMVSDLTLHAYSIQRPILTSSHSLFSYAPTPRHASERFILLHLKHISFLHECVESVPASTHWESSFRHIILGAGAAHPAWLKLISHSMPDRYMKATA